MSARVSHAENIREPCGQESGRSLMKASKKTSGFSDLTLVMANVILKAIICPKNEYQKEFYIPIMTTQKNMERLDRFLSFLKIRELSYNLQISLLALSVGYVWVLFSSLPPMQPVMWGKISLLLLLFYLSAI